MAMYDIIYDRSQAHAGLSALIGTRMYPQVLPQKVTLPAASYQQVSGGPTRELVDLHDERWQIKAFATTYLEAKDVATQIIAAYEDFTDTDGTPCLSWMWKVGEIDTYDPEIGMMGVYITIVDFMARVI